MATPDGFLAHLSDTLARASDDAARIETVSRHRRQLLADPDNARRLVERAIEADVTHPGHPDVQLLERSLDEARMDANGSGALGRPFLEAAQKAVTQAVNAGRVSFYAATTLAAAFWRAECSVPTALQTVAEESKDRGAAPAPGEVAELLDQLEAAAAGDAFQLYHGLKQAMGALPSEGQRMLVQLTTSRGHRLHQRLGLYWLFDPQPELRLEAARALGGQIDALAADLKAWLRDLCRLLPSDDARAHLTGILAESPQPQPPSSPEGDLAAWASLPDGAGTQMVAVASGPAEARTVALAMVRAGQGLQDAFTMPGSDENQGDTLTALQQMDARQIPIAAAHRLLLTAAAETLAGGQPPPAGIVDVLMASGASDLALPSQEDDWLAHLPASEDLASLTKQKRGRLINASAAWSSTYPLVSSWFEGPASFPDLSAAHTVSNRARQVRTHLETRRDWWRELMLRAAFVLQANGDQNWRSFAVTARALAEGRALKKIPIMEEIAEASLDALTEAAQTPSGGWIEAGYDDEDAAPAAGGDLDLSWLADLPLEVVEAQPPSAEEVPDLLKAAGRPADAAWLDGYVMAIGHAPKPLPMPTWTSALADPVKHARGADAHERFQDLLIDRDGAVADALGDQEALRTWLQSYDGDAYGAWAAGFTAAVTEHGAAWPRQRLRKDDRKILDDLAAAAAGRPVAFSPRVVASWLAARTAGRG